MRDFFYFFFRVLHYFIKNLYILIVPQASLFVTLFSQINAKFYRYKPYKQYKEQALIFSMYCHEKEYLYYYY